MNRLIINGGKALKGSIEINGAKNAYYDIMKIMSNTLNFTV